MRAAENNILLTEKEGIALSLIHIYQIISCSIPKDKITKIALQQTLFQIPTKCCDVHIYTWAEGTKRQRVLNMYLPEVLDLLAPEAFFELEKEKPF